MQLTHDLKQRLTRAAWENAGVPRQSFENASWKALSDYITSVCHPEFGDVRGLAVSSSDMNSIDRWNECLQSGPNGLASITLASRIEVYLSTPDDPDVVLKSRITPIGDLAIHAKDFWSCVDKLWYIMHLVEEFDQYVSQA